MEDLLALYRRQVTAKPPHDIMEFRGIAKDLWKDVNVEEYLREERQSWECESADIFKEEIHVYLRL